MTFLQKHSKPVTQGIVSSAIFQVLWNGGSALIAWIAGHYASLSGIGPQWAILTSALVFFLFALSYHLIWRKRRTADAPRQPESPQAALTESTCSDAWLHEVAKLDKQALEHRVVITGCRIITMQLSEAPPEVVFEFSVLNVSVFPVRLDESHPKFGNIIFASKSLLYPPSIIWSNQDYPHGASGWFRLTQQLTEGELDRLRRAGLQCSFVFKDVKIMVSGGREFESMFQPFELKQRLQITLEGHVYPARP
jgi:hypothetical protein